MAGGETEDNTVNEMGRFRLVAKGDHAGCSPVCLVARTHKDIGLSADPQEDAFWKLEAAMDGCVLLRSEDAALGDEPYLAATELNEIITTGRASGSSAWWKMEAGNDGWLRLRNQASGAQGACSYLVVDAAGGVAASRSSGASDVASWWKLESDCGDLLRQTASAGVAADAEAEPDVEKAKDAEEAEKQKKAMEEEEQAHIREFTRSTGISPRRCWHLVLVCLVLRTIGWSMISMVMLEYTRFYIINDLNVISTIETATGSPQALLKAFLFPFWGIVSDRASRKKVLAAGSVAQCISAWLLVWTPSISTLVLTRCLSLVGDIRGTIHNAMLRDLFSSSQWESRGAGVTGIKSRMAVVWTFTSAGAIAFGMGTLKLGDMGWTGLPNEFSAAGQCKDQRYCDIGDGWQIHGALRLLLLIGAIALSAEALVIVFIFPETLKPEFQTDKSVTAFLRRQFREMASPWNNLRVFATVQLRELLSIRFIHYIIGSGGSALFLSWYRRSQLDTFTMYTMGVAGGATGFIVMCCVIKIVTRFGDLRGVWIPANVLALLYGVSTALTPSVTTPYTASASFYLTYVFFALFGGPSGTLAGFTPDLLSKLMPPDVQGTFQTSKSFLYNLQRAVMVWPWLGLYVWSESLPYPLDALSIWVAVLLGVVALWLTLKQLPKDPAAAIAQGQGKVLEPYWSTPYVKGRWYRKHGGRQSSEALEAKVASMGSGPTGAMQGRAMVAEGSTKVGLILSDTDDVALAHYVQFLMTEMPRSARGRSISLVLGFLEPPEASSSPRPSPSKSADIEDGVSTETNVDEGASSSHSEVGSTAVAVATRPSA